MTRTLLSLPVAAALFAGSALAQGSVNQIFNPPGLPNSVQNGYSQVATAPAGLRDIHVSGQVGYTQDGPNDFQSQVDRAFANLGTALKAAGAGYGDVVKITLLVVDYDPAKLDYLVRNRRETFGKAPPASIMIPVPALYARGVLFEIGATAVSDPANPRGAK